jgi:hypothetical protein
LFALRLGIALQTHYNIYILDKYPINSDALIKQRFIENGFSPLNRFQDLPKWKESSTLY